MKTILIVLLCCACAIMLFLFYAIASTPPNYEPEDGIWFCEDLQIQLDYSGGNETFAVIDGQKIICCCGSDRGVKQLEVRCQQPDHPVFDLCEMVFCAEIKELTNDTFLVFDPSTGAEYSFIRKTSG